MAGDALIAVPLGFALGFLIGLTGVGGGALVAPALYVLLGLAYQDAIALSLVYSVFTKIVGALQHIRQGTVVWNVTLLYGLTGIPGAVIGSKMLYWVGPASERAFPFVMGAILLVVATLILLQTALSRVAAWPKPFTPDALTPITISGVAAFQTVVGLLIGSTSVGSGSLVILSMLYLFRMTAPQIVGSNIVIALLLIVPAGLTHYAAGGVAWSLLGLLLAGSVAGAVLGARAVVPCPEPALKVAIVLLLVLGAVSTVLKAWYGGVP